MKKLSPEQIQEQLEREKRYHARMDRILTDACWVIPTMIALVVLIWIGASRWK